jgi:hypothetical protein
MIAQKKKKARRARRMKIMAQRRAEGKMLPPPKSKKLEAEKKARRSRAAKKAAATKKANQIRWQTLVAATKADDSDSDDDLFLTELLERSLKRRPKKRRPTRTTTTSGKKERSKRRPKKRRPTSKKRSKAAKKADMSKLLTIWPELFLSGVKNRGHMPPGLPLSGKWWKQWIPDEPRPVVGDILVNRTRHRTRHALYRFYQIVKLNGKSQITIRPLKTRVTRRKVFSFGSFQWEVPRKGEFVEGGILKKRWYSSLKNPGHAQLGGRYSLDRILDHPGWNGAYIYVKGNNYMHSWEGLPEREEGDENVIT